MVFDPTKPISLGGNDKAIHPKSIPPDDNALVIPEQMVQSKRGNEQLHIVPRMTDNGIVLNFMTYVVEGDWNGMKWSGYVSKQRASPPTLTIEGAALLAEQLPVLLVALRSH